MKWYDKYTGFKYVHLGNSVSTGIDCLNLIRYIYLKELNIEIPYSTQDFCDDANEHWYSRIKNTKYYSPFSEFRNPKWGWSEVNKEELNPFNVVTIFIGSSEIVNHCAMYVGDNKILNIMIDKPSWLAPYGSYYKQYTDGAYKWIGLNN